MYCTGLLQIYIIRNVLLTQSKLLTMLEYLKNLFT
jgi:hypothetical protein